MKKLGKYLGYAVVAVVLCLIICFSIPFIKLLCTESGRVLIGEKVKEFGIFAPIVFVGIEILQIVAAFVPGAPIEVMSGVLFGGFWGIVWCVSGVFIGTIIVFNLVKKFGRPLVEKVFPNKKFDDLKLLKDERKLTMTVFILFLIPGTPKDFLTYLAGLTKIKPSKFYLITAVARTPSMACSVMMGANIGKGRFVAGLLIFIGIIVLSLVGYCIKRFCIDKNKN